MARQRDDAVTAWSPARIYLVASGVYLLLTSAAGFLTNSTFPTSSDQVAHDTGHIFGVLETNGWHNLAGVVSGVLALGFAIRSEWARLGALFKGVLYVFVTSSIALWGGETFLIASNAADQVVHASLAVGGLVCGLATKAWIAGPHRPMPHPPEVRWTANEPQPPL